MRSRRTKHKLTAAALAIVAGGLIGAGPATADCLSAEVWVQRPNQSKQYVVGPKRCVVQTPFNEVFDIQTSRGEPSVGTVGAGVWVPAP